jgi:hypothetical protein
MDSKISKRNNSLIRYELPVRRGQSEALRNPHAAERQVLKLLNELANLLRDLLGQRAGTRPSPGGGVGGSGGINTKAIPEEGGVVGGNGGISTKAFPEEGGAVGSVNPGFRTLAVGENGGVV